MKEISLKTEKLPAFCAHRGVSGLMPENSLPAFGAALALGADEIELDVWLTKDGQLVVSHDVTLDRISNGTGKVSDYTLEELKKFNIGVKLGWEVGFCSMEEVFAQFANRIIMNIHLKEAGPNGEVVKQLAEMAERYDAVFSRYNVSCSASSAQIRAHSASVMTMALCGSHQTCSSYSTKSESGAGSCPSASPSWSCSWA